jgi:Protein of unknown function (DUF3096)
MGLNLIAILIRFESDGLDREAVSPKFKKAAANWGCLQDSNQATEGCCVTLSGRAWMRHLDCHQRDHSHHSRRFEMVLTAGHITPLVALIAGILILIIPSLLNYIVAVYLIVVGLIGLNGIYHFIN